MKPPPPSLEERVARTIDKFHRWYNQTEKQLRIGVAVSGGSDSVCLLHVLRALNFPLAVLHVNHLLRGPDSNDDEAFVSDLAVRLGLKLHVKQARPISAGNLEEEARRLRYEFFHELVHAGAIDQIATGHTESDQAETVLFRILRGAHSRGLAAIHPVQGPIIRPLIEITRDEAEAYLVGIGQPWRTDSSNQDPAFARNRIRHHLLPLLKRDWNPEIERTLAHQARLAFDEEAYWRHTIGQIGSQMFQLRGNNLVLDASKLVEHPVAVARRLVRHAIETVKGDLLGIGFEHVEQILELAAQLEGHGRLQAPGIDVMRSFEWLRVAPALSQDKSRDRLEERNYETDAPLGGVAVLPEGMGWIKLDVIDNTEVNRDNSGVWESARVEESALDLDRVLAFGSTLRLRTWKPGDQFSRALGSAAGTSVKVKQLFQDGRIPLWDRALWPMITAGQQIIWVKQFGPAAEVTANRDTRRILRVQEIYR